MGSKHQKHSAFAPTPFVYRFTPEGKKPTVAMMKYFHTLGCFPSGLEVPMRLDEFRETYLKEHVPEEVEEWLGCFIRRPAEAIDINVRAALAGIAAIERPEPTLHRRALPATNILTAAEPIRLALEGVGVDVPPFAVRCAVRRPRLRARLTSALTAWNDAVQQSGSTPHRRVAARQALIDAGLADAGTAAPGALAAKSADVPDSPAALASSSSSGGPSGERVHGQLLSQEGVAAVRGALALPATTAADERSVLEVVTVLAEAAQREARHDLAEKLLREGLRHAHDDEAEGYARANYASALNGCGRHAAAEAEAREAVLLSRRPAAYAQWAVAVAYQDDMDGAAAIVEDGLAQYPGDATLLATSESLAKAMAGREAVPAEARGKRVHAKTALRLAITTAPSMTSASVSGRVMHKGKLIDGSVDPTELTPRHWSRRSADHGNPLQKRLHN